MKPIDFDEATNTLQPSGKTYSENVGDVRPLPVFSDGEQCISCWRLSWKERLSALIFGKVWLAVLTGHSQPPVYMEVARTYFVKKEGAGSSRESDAGSVA